jgi:hypothetical protein
MTNARKTGRKKIKKKALFFCTLFFLPAILFFILSCSNIKITAIEDGFIQMAPDSSTGNSKEGPAQESSASTTEPSSGKDVIYFFDYSSVKIEPTQSMDLLIKNCNIYMDIYGDIIVLGEIENLSNAWKTDIEITFNFNDSSGTEIDFVKTPAFASYLQPGSIMPFYLVYTERPNYINISSVKIGTNFRNYNKSPKGLPILAEENRGFTDKIFNVNGKVTNIGDNSIEDLKIFCTFYNLKNQVVFIKKCYIKEDMMDPLEEQDYSLEVLMDEYLPEYTHYRFGAFFRDSLKIPVHE